MRALLLLAVFIIAGLVIFFIGAREALACSCGGWENAQQSAQNKNVIVAKVKTLQLSKNGTGQLKVLKVLKGQIDPKTIKVVGQDGVNCNGEILPSSQPWVVLLTKSAGRYATVSCADSSLPLDPKTGKFKVSLGEDMLLSEVELRQVINYQMQPTVKGVRCEVSANRLFVQGDASNDATDDNEFNFEYSAEIPARKDGELRAHASFDLSKEGKNLKVLKVDVVATQQNATAYKMTVDLVEPFSSRSIRTESTVDMRKSYVAVPASISRYVDMNGVEIEDQEDKGGTPSFLSLQTSASCGLQVGRPLVPIQN